MVNILYCNPEPRILPSALSSPVEGQGFQPPPPPLTHNCPRNAREIRKSGRTGLRAGGQILQIICFGLYSWMWHWYHAENLPPDMWINRVDCTRSWCVSSQYFGLCFGKWKDAVWDMLGDICPDPAGAHERKTQKILEKGRLQSSLWVLVAHGQDAIQDAGLLLTFRQV